VRVVFMGTPHFATPSLRALAANAAPGHIWSSGLDLVGVVTRPDKPVGRSRTPVPSPVKMLAQELHLPVYQPGSLRKPESLHLMLRLAPDLIVVAAFGQILPPDVLCIPEHCCLNVHASLLPRHRGASPVASAILDGDRETGVSIMLMEEGLDTGPILSQAMSPIGEHETAGELTWRLAEMGAHLLVETLPRWLASGLEPTPQDESRATMSRLLRKEDGRLDWSKPADVLDRQVRAYTPWPAAFTTWNGKQFKIVQARPLVGAAAEAPGVRAPGTVFVTQQDERELLACTCGQGAIVFEVVQLEGRRALPAADFLRGNSAIVGSRLGADVSAA
jgi:methionyl-tRNA formyltransferase